MKKFLPNISQKLGIMIQMEQGNLEVNPVLKKDLLFHLRKNRVYLTFFVYVLFTAFIFLLFYYFATEDITNLRRPGSGETIFWTLASIQFIIAFFGPGRLAANSFTLEREKKTLDSLLLTNLHSKEIFTGKLYSAVGSLFLILIGCFPFISLSILMGGVSPKQVLIVSLITLILVFMTGILGICTSIIYKTSKSAHNALIAFQFFIPLIATIFAPLMVGEGKGYIIFMLLYFVILHIVFIGLAADKLKKLRA